MALDFPASPIDGQIFGAYTWNAARGVWLQTNMSSRVVTTSDTPPASPTNGDMWMYTVDGTCFIYYNDGTSGQWVEQSKSILTPATYQSPNYIINGAFDIWQRGTSIATGTGSPYTADRWQTLRAGAVAGMTTTRQSSGLTGVQYCGRFQRDSGNTSAAALQAWQTLETTSSIPLAGSSVTLSFYARAGANYSATGGAFISSLYTGTGTDQNLNIGGFTSATVVGTATPTLTTSWQRFSFTASIGASTTQLGLLFQANVTGTAGANDYFEVTGVQLEAGSTATAFRRNAPSIQAELAACQRYYQFHDFIVGSGDSAGYKFATNPLGQLLRATPTITATTTGGPSQSPVYSTAIAQSVLGKGGFANGSGATAGAYVIFTNVIVNAEL